MKNSIRQEILLKRESQTITEKSQKENLINKKILQLPEFQSAKFVLSYSAFKGEANLAEINQKILESKTLILPKVSGIHLNLYQIDNLTELQLGYAGILEAAEHHQQILPEKIDLAIIPGIAFDPNGNRLGFGRGFYDRLLPKLNCPIIATAFDFQIVNEIPTESHDHPVNIIITESRTITPPSKS